MGTLALCPISVKLAAPSVMKPGVNIRDARLNNTVPGTFLRVR